MKLHFAPTCKFRFKRFFKRLPMDTGLEWDMFYFIADNDNTSAGI